MAKLIDLTGQRFEKLTVITRAENTKNNGSKWVCKCDCGNETVVSASNLKNGAVKSCGCLRRTSHNYKHRESHTRLYRMWISMLYRCENQNYTAYKDYGQRGICVCDEWHDFLTFKKWVEKTKPTGEFTLDRINNDKGYFPNNCRWVGRKEQANNRRSNIIIEYQGESHTLQIWSEILNFNYKTVHNRIYKLGWSFEDAISKPIDMKKSRRKG